MSKAYAIAKILKCSGCVSIIKKTRRLTVHGPFGVGHEVAQAPECFFFVHVHQQQGSYLRHSLAVTWKTHTVTIGAMKLEWSLAYCFFSSKPLKNAAKKGLYTKPLQYDGSRHDRTDHSSVEDQPNANKISLRKIDCVFCAQFQKKSTQVIYFKNTDQMVEQNHRVSFFSGRTDGKLVNGWIY